jgi:hypothetical protein
MNFRQCFITQEEEKERKKICKKNSRADLAELPREASDQREETLPELQPATFDTAGKKDGALTKG